MIEFESTALMIGQLGLRVNLIAYPVVSVKKVSIQSLLRLHWSQYVELPHQVTVSGANCNAEGPG